MVSGSSSRPMQICQMFLSASPESAGNLTEYVSGCVTVFPKSSDDERNVPQRKLWLPHHSRFRPARVSSAMVYPGDPTEYGPPTLQRLRPASDRTTNAPFIVPTRTRTSPRLADTCWTDGMKTSDKFSGNRYCKTGESVAGLRKRNFYFSRRAL